MRLGRREDEEGVGRRLLQRLEQRVEGRWREHVHLVEDVDLLVGALRRDADRLAQLAHVVDAVVGGGVHLDDVQGAAGLEAAAGLAGPARLGVGPLRQRRLAVDGLGDEPGGGRLAHAARTREEVGVREAVAEDGVAERLGHVLLGDEVAEGLRSVLPGGDEVARLGGVGHGGVPVGSRGRGKLARPSGNVRRRPLAEGCRGAGAVERGWRGGASGAEAGTAASERQAMPAVPLTLSRGERGPRGRRGGARASGARGEARVAPVPSPQSPVPIPRSRACPPAGRRCGARRGPRARARPRR